MCGLEALKGFTTGLNVSGIISGHSSSSDCGVERARWLVDQCSLFHQQSSQRLAACGVGGLDGSDYCYDEAW